MKPPEDSLSYYFDELLSGDFDNNAQISLPLAVGDNFLSSNVVNLNTRHKSSISNEKKTHVLRETIKNQVKPLAEFSEPSTSIQEQEKKQKLEKLLQTAQQQILKQEQKVEPEVQTQLEVKIEQTIYKEEIQDWPIESNIVVEEEQKQTIQQKEIVIFEGDCAFSEISQLEWAENGLPQWAQEKFDVLLFDVAGLTLAVPLISLGQIYPLTDELTPLFGQVDWFMGLQPTPMGKIRTVNTARFVMPEKYKESFLEKARYVMSLNGVNWGLALDSVNQPMRLHPDQVKWRGDRSKRPWLAGTIKDHMCALLDVPRIAKLLLEMDKNYQKNLKNP